MVTRCDHPGCFKEAPLGFYISVKEKPEADYETIFKGDFCKVHSTELVDEARKAVGLVKKEKRE